jgi:putative transposase
LFLRIVLSATVYYTYGRQCHSARGLSVADVCRKIGVSEATYHRWRQRFSGVQADETRRVKQLESEVARLKELVAELLLDKRMLQDVAKKKW